MEDRTKGWIAAYVVLVLATLASLWWVRERMAVTPPSEITKPVPSAAAAPAGTRADPSGEVSPEPAQMTREALLERARSAVTADQATVVYVLADGMAAGESSWARQWVEQLAEARPVDVSAWDAEHEEWGAPVDVREPVKDAVNPVRVYLAADDTASADWAAQTENVFVEAPDLVLASYGVSLEGDAAAQLDALQKAVDEQGRGIPVVVMQEPGALDGTGDDARADVADWAAQNDVPTVDVEKAFEGSADDVATLMADNAVPNQQGAGVWAGALAELIGPAKA